MTHACAAYSRFRRERERVPITHCGLVMRIVCAQRGRDTLCANTTAISSAAMGDKAGGSHAAAADLLATLDCTPWRPTAERSPAIALSPEQKRHRMHEHVMPAVLFQSAEVDAGNDGGNCNFVQSEAPSRAAMRNQLRQSAILSTCAADAAAPHTYNKSAPSC